MVVSKVIPPRISPPDPLLGTTKEGSFEGLRPRALSVPAGERSNGMISARAQAMEARRKRRSTSVFMADSRCLVVTGLD